MIKFWVGLLAAAAILVGAEAAHADPPYDVSYACDQAAVYDAITYEAGRYLPTSFGPVVSYDTGGHQQLTPNYYRCYRVHIVREDPTTHVQHSCTLDIATAGYATTQTSWGVVPGTEACQ